MFKRGTCAGPGVERKPRVGRAEARAGARRSGRGRLCRHHVLTVTSAFNHITCSARLQKLAHQVGGTRSMGRSCKQKL